MPRALVAASIGDGEARYPKRRRRRRHLATHPVQVALCRVVVVVKTLQATVTTVGPRFRVNLVVAAEVVAAPPVGVELVLTPGAVRLAVPKVVAPVAGLAIPVSVTQGTEAVRLAVSEVVVLAAEPVVPLPATVQVKAGPGAAAARRAGVAQGAAAARPAEAQQKREVARLELLQLWHQVALVVAQAEVVLRRRRPHQHRLHRRADGHHHHHHHPLAQIPVIACFPQGPWTAAPVQPQVSAMVEVEAAVAAVGQRTTLWMPGAAPRGRMMGLTSFFKAAPLRTVVVVVAAAAVAVAATAAVGVGAGLVVRPRVGVGAAAPPIALARAQVPLPA